MGSELMINKQTHPHETLLIAVSTLEKKRIAGVIMDWGSLGFEKNRPSPTAIVVRS